MTEAEWLRSPDTTALLTYMRGKAGPRKLRLLAVACVKYVEHRLRGEAYRGAIVVAEAVAEGARDGRDLDDLHQRLYLDWCGDRSLPAQSPESRAAFAALGCVNPDAFSAANSVAGSVQAASTLFEPFTSRTGADLLRDIFGNPFRPVAVDPDWRTATVVALARAIYHDRAFDRLPVLADALDDAGCDSVDLLGHLRDPALTHVRGCWAVDLVLGLS